MRGQTEKHTMLRETLSLKLKAKPTAHPLHLTAKLLQKFSKKSIPCQLAKSIYHRTEIVLCAQLMYCFI